jgi:fatty acid desaturase
MLHSALLLLAISQGVLVRYLLFWLLLERVIGAVVQFRGLVEHHGLWQAQSCHLLTQLYASRSITASGFLNALMGGLPHHSIHHAFPWIPAARLPLASQRIAAVLERHGAPALPQLSSYGQALTMLWREAPLISINQSASGG